MSDQYPPDKPQPPAGGAPPPAGGAPPPGQTPAAGPGGGAPPPGPLQPAGPGGGGGGGQAQPNPYGYSIGDAFNYGWSKFQQNVGAILLGVLAYIAAVAILTFIWFLMIGVLTSALGSMGSSDAMLAGGFFGFLFTVSIGLLVMYIGIFIVQAGITRAALAITYGETIEFKSLFAFDGIGQLVLGSILLGIATSVGFLLCGLPGIIVLFFSQFFVHFLLDKRMSAIDAIKASFGFVNKNLATLIGFFIATMIANFLGSLVCFIGFLVAFPVVVIAQAYTYRKLQGEPVAA